MKSAATQKALEMSKAVMRDEAASGSPFDLAAATATFETRCSQCHSPILVQANPPGSEEAATMLVTRMVGNGLRASVDELTAIIGDLTATGEPAPSASPAPPAPAPVPTPEPLAQIDREIIVRPAGAELRFENTEIEVKTGARLRLVLDNPAASGQTHNFVLVRDPDADDDVSTEALGAPDTGFVPAHDQILVAIPAQSAGNQGTAERIAPAPGRDLFGCMMPGHSFTMQGTLVVTE